MVAISFVAVHMLSASPAAGLEVRKIINRKKIDGKVHYKVVPKGAGLKPIWLPADSSDVTADSIAEFKAEIKKQAAKGNNGSGDKSQAPEVAPLGQVSSIDKLNFGEQVQQSAEVWMVEFGSEMCGSCAAFSPVYHALAEAHPTVRAGYVNIDKPEGMDLAQQLSILEGGIPAVVVFKTTGGPPQPIMRGAPLSERELAAELEAILNGLVKGRNGIYAKMT